MQRQTTPITLTIPDGVRFADLRLAREPDNGDLSLDWAPVERICAASGLDLAVFRDAPEDNLAALVVAWYAQARAAGEPADATAEDLIAETAAEERIGQRVSLPPGRA